MSRTLVLWGHRIGTPDWDEEVIAEAATRAEIEQAKGKAVGFDRFRVMVDDGAAPDFASTVRH
jgi:hypothetical protein